MIRKFVFLAVTVLVAIGSSADASDYRLIPNHVSFSVRVKGPDDSSYRIYEQLQSMDIDSKTTVDNSGASEETILAFFDINQVKLYPGARIVVDTKLVEEGKGSARKAVFELKKGKAAFLVRRDFALEVEVHAGTGVFRLPASVGRAEDVVFNVWLEEGMPKCIVKNGIAYIQENDTLSCIEPKDPDSFGWANPIPDIPIFRADSEYYDEVSPPVLDQRNTFGGEFDKFKIATYPQQDRINRGVWFYASLVPPPSYDPEISCIVIMVPDGCKYQFVTTDLDERIAVAFPDNEDFKNLKILLLGEDQSRSKNSEDAKIHTGYSYSPQAAPPVFKARCDYASSRIWPIVIKKDPSYKCYYEHKEGEPQ